MMSNKREEQAKTALAPLRQVLLYSLLFHRTSNAPYYVKYSSTLNMKSVSSASMGQASLWPFPTATKSELEILERLMPRQLSRSRSRESADVTCGWEIIHTRFVTTVLELRTGGLGNA